MFLCVRLTVSCDVSLPNCACPSLFQFVCLTVLLCVRLTVSVCVHCVCPSMPHCLIGSRCVRLVGPPTLRLQLCTAEQPSHNTASGKIPAAAANGLGDCRETPRQARRSANVHFDSKFDAITTRRQNQGLSQSGLFAILCYLT